MMVRKYNGYEPGIWFFNDKVTGQAIIFTMWNMPHSYCDLFHSVTASFWAY